MSAASEIQERLLGSLIPVLVPVRPTDLESLTDQERWDYEVMIFRDLIHEYGMEEAKRRTPGWMDYIDPETGEVRFPEEDMQYEMVRRGQAARAAKAIVVEDPDDSDEERTAEYLRSQGIE